MLTLVAKSLHTHADGKGSVVVVVEGGGAAAGCTAGMKTLGSVLTAGAGAVVVVVEGGGCVVDVVGAGFTRATAS